MRILFSLLGLMLLFTGCGTTRCLNCPFTSEETAKSSNLAELNLTWELFEVTENQQAGKKIGLLYFARDGEITEQQWLTMHIEITGQDQQDKLPPFRALGADLNGETFLAVSLDLPELARKAGFSQPGNLAIPVYSLLKLSKNGNNSFLAESLTFARYKNSTWEPIDPLVQVNGDGLVINEAESLRHLLQGKKYDKVGLLMLKKKP